MLSLRATIVEWNARSTHESPSGRALCDVGCYPVIIGGRRHPYSRRRRRRRFSPHPFGASRMLLLPTRTRRSYVRSVELHHRPQSRLDLPAGQRETRTSVLGAWDSHAVARYSSVLKTLGILSGELRFCLSATDEIKSGSPGELLASKYD